MIGGFHSLVLFCTDTDASKACYEAAGFTFLRGYEGMNWFSLGDGEVMLHPSDAGPAGHVPEAHAVVDELDRLFEHVRSQGLVPQDHQGDGTALIAPVVRPWGARVFELVDPDGHRWAFIERGTY